MNTPKDSTGGCCPPPPCSEVCFRSAKTKAWGLYPGNLGDIDRLAFRGVVYKPDRKMSTREVCALPGPFEAECAHREALAFLERVDEIFSPNQLIKTLADQLREVDNATLGLKSTYKKIAQCSKTVAQLEKLGVDHITAYDKAAQINGVADHETVGLA